MEKKEIEEILYAMKVTENEVIVNYLLEKISKTDELSLKRAAEKVGGTREAVKNFFEKKIAEKMNNHNESHKPINEMFSYGFAGSCVHLHMPVNLHQMLSERGISGTIDTVNLYLIDAIDRVSSLKQKGCQEFEKINSIYMISPILLGRELKFLQGLGFHTKAYRKRELNDEEFLQSNSEASLATHIFGKDKNVGTAKIDFDTIFSDIWQEKKNKILEQFALKGITFINKKTKTINRVETDDLVQ